MASKRRPKCKLKDLAELDLQLAVDVLRAAGYTKGLAQATVRALHEASASANGNKEPNA